MTKVIEIWWAFVKAHWFVLRHPLRYRVISKTTVVLLDREGWPGTRLEEEYSYIGVMEDIPDVTDHSIIHKLVPVKTYYGKWEEPYVPKVPIGEDDREFVSLEEFFERTKADE